MRAGGSAGLEARRYDRAERCCASRACDRGRLSVDEAGQTRLGGRTRSGKPKPTPASGTRLRLGLDVDGAELRFRQDTGSGWEPFGPTPDATVLSDEHAEQIEDGRIRSLGSTGAFAGLWAWDLTGGGHHADFDEVTYRSGH
ncbi:hypothetical protein ACIBQ7_27750 [Streptomyces massasporeus]|uniref:beta-xylosidase family glycoside hydrolase n=1 Tax=Streptomyces massasporeus TaxID=67324 RepID=UPI0037A48D3F